MNSQGTNISSSLFSPLLLFILLKKALKAGKHVLCEKPIGSNQREAEEMAKIANENGVISFQFDFYFILFYLTLFYFILFILLLFDYK